MIRTAIRFSGRILGLLLLLTGFSSVAFAIVQAPELDPTSASSAVALLVGAALLAADRFRKP
jgi:hypothetical protein